MEQTDKNNECRWCKHLNYEVELEGAAYSYTCDKTGYDNLRGFPFNTTKCKKFEKRQNFVKLNTSEIMNSFFKTYSKK